MNTFFKQGKMFDLFRLYCLRHEYGGLTDRLRPLALSIFDPYFMRMENKCMWE